MTKQEHLLLIVLLTKQAQVIQMLVSLLKSRGIATEDDMSAFQFATVSDQQLNVALFRQTSRDYVALAKGLGLEVGIEIP
jgi:hypothetical protein